MMLAYYTCLILAVVLSALFLIWPWIEESAAAAAMRDEHNPLPRLREWLQEKDLLIEHLKDLELDFQMEKLTEEDYQALRQDLLQQSLDLEKTIETYESSQSLLQQIEADRLSFKESGS